MLGRAACGRGFEIFRTRKNTRSGGVAGSDLLLDLAPRGAVGNIEIVASLQIDPELRRCAEIAREAHGRVGRDRTPPKHDIVDPRAWRLDRVGEFVIFSSDNDSKGVQETVKILQEKLPSITLKDFHEYGHFTLGSMKTDAFPELLEAII